MTSLTVMNAATDGSELSTSLNASGNVSNHATSTNMTSLRAGLTFESAQMAVTSIQKYAKQCQNRGIRIGKDTSRFTLVRQHPPQHPNDHNSHTHAFVIGCENAPDCKWFVLVERVDDPDGSAPSSSTPTWQITSLNLDHHPERCRSITQQQQYPEDPMNPASVYMARNPNTMAMASAQVNQLLSGSVTSQQLPPLNGTNRYAPMDNHYLVGAGTPVTTSSPLDNDSLRRPTTAAEMMGTGVMPMMYNPEALGKRPALNANSYAAASFDMNFGLGGGANGAMSAPMMSFQDQLKAVDLPNMAADPTSSSAGMSSNSSPSFLTEKSSMVLTTKMRWISAKEASKAVNDYALFVQKKRARMDKKTSGGRNKKYVCSCAHCGWFVRLIKVTKSGNWKISSMQLNHSPDCTGEAQPSARQLAEMHAFRDAVISNAKSTGRVITNEFLDTSEWGVKIPLRLAYRAKKMILEKRNASCALDEDDSNDEEDEASVGGDGSSENGNTESGSKRGSSCSGPSAKRARPSGSLSGVTVPESYKFIPSLLQKFSDSVPGSVVALKKDDKGRFKGVFIFPTGISLSIWKHCFQRVFGLEIVPCTSPQYDGKFIVLLGRDGNLEYRTIACALIPKADQSNVSWFLRSVETSGMLLNDSVVYMSCDERSTLQVFQREFPHVKTMLCMESIMKCLQRQTDSLEMTASLRLQVEKIRQQDTIEGFEQHMQELQQLSPAAVVFLRSLVPSQWALYANQTTRLFGWNSTGFAEYSATARRAMSDDDPQQQSSNSTNAAGAAPTNGTGHGHGSRHNREEVFPTFGECAPFDILYKYLSHLMNQDSRRRSQLAEYVMLKDYGIGSSQKKALMSPLTWNADALYRVQLEEAEKYNVELIDPQQLNVIPFGANAMGNSFGFGNDTDPSVSAAGGSFGYVAFVWNSGIRPKQTYRVNLQEHCCSCSQMYQMGIPCAHFIAVAQHMKKEEVLFSSFDEIYHLTMYEQSLLTMNVADGGAITNNGNVNLNGQHHHQHGHGLELVVARMPQVSELGKDSSVLPPPCCMENKSAVVEL